MGPCEAVLGPAHASVEVFRFVFVSGVGAGERECARTEIQGKLLRKPLLAKPGQIIMSEWKVV